MRFALLIGLLLAAPAAACAGKLPWKVWTPPASCDKANAEAIDGTETVDANNAADALGECDAGVSWHKFRLVHVNLGGQVNVSYRVLAVRRRKKQVEVVVEETSICRGAAMITEWQTWLRIPAGRDPVSLVTVPGPRDSKPCLAP
jgi:hypothetical protein